MTKTTFTSESVCAGHPDKICDAVSDAILDAVLEQDPNGHVGVETLAACDRLVMAGEVKTSAKINFVNIARKQIQRLGYTDKRFNFSDKSPVDNFIHEQSPEIAVGVDHKGAGDQGMMFGYACTETPELMPLPIILAHQLTRRVDEMRNDKTLGYLWPDGKSQITVEYLNGKPIGVAHVVVAVPHKEEIKLERVKKDVYEIIVKYVLDQYGFKISPKNLIVNGTGVWHNGGPASDCGVTGRKIVVDGYGGYARVGGGAFSGKDPTKVDRSGAYAARFIAKNIVARKFATKAEVRLAYFIGARKPVMMEVETFGTNKKSQRVIDNFAAKILDTSVVGIIKGLDLLRPIYLSTAAYGHFGREEFPWEKIVK